MTGFAHDAVVWSLFSGAMGLDLGLEAEGIRASLAVEVESVFCETIRLNRPELQVLRADVKRIDGDTLRRLTGHDEVDLMVGGPPCQSFCPGGKRAALSDPRGNLIFEYLRLISEVRPRRFVLENVANLVTAAIRHRPIDQRPGKSWNLSSYSSRPIPLFNADDAPSLEEDELSGSAIKHLLETAIAEMGYRISFGVLDAASFGAPQRRYRLVMLGDRDGFSPPLPSPTHGLDLAPVKTVRDAIEDLIEDAGPGSRYTESVRAVFDLVPPGGNWRDLPPDVARAAMGERSYRAGGGKTGFFRRLGWDAPSPTITGKANRKGSAMCHPSRSRPLSIRECARLQGFPDEWRFSGSAHQQYLQIGNAVPVDLGRAVGKAIKAPSVTEGPANEEMFDAAVRVLKASARNKAGRKVGRG